MGAPKPTYDWYLSAFGGTLGEEEFMHHLPLAVLEIADMCMGKSVPEAAETAYKAAICSAVDTYAEYGNGPSVGFSVGAFTMQASGNDSQAIARNRARKILFPTGLLYAGIGGL